MEKFIYVPVELKGKLMSLGFREVMSCNMNGTQYYVFHNDVSKYSTFSIEDKAKMLFTNKMIFV